MRIPIVRGLIERRMLVNYRVDPDVLSRHLPEPFRPKLVNGFGVAGICLIRLAQVRPRFVPRLCGIASENAAHRVAVEWEQDGRHCEGVYIPRRDTSSRLNALAGGRLFPGVHHRARFQVTERDGLYRVAVDSRDGGTHVLVEGRVTDRLPSGSVFGSLEACSAFFEQGFLGYSATRHEGRFDGLELRCFDWRVEPLDVARVESSLYDDPAAFPPGSIEFDCALLMRQIEHEWHGRPELRTEATSLSSRAMSADVGGG